MIRLTAVLAVVAALAAACSGGSDSSAPTTASTPAPAPTTTESEEPAAPATPPTRIVVVDGDTGSRVAGASVRHGDEAAAGADSLGRAQLELGAHKSVVLRVGAQGYMPAEAPVRTHRGGRQVVVRLYRPETQWPMYGANPARTQVQSSIRLRPPFRIVWGRRLDSLVEFPAVVWKGVAYADSIKGYTTAISMRNGKVLWRTRVGTLMAASPTIVPDRNEAVVVTMSPGEVLVLDLETGRVRFRRSIGRAEPSAVIRNDVAYFAAANGTAYALDLRRRRFRWSHSLGEKITSSPALVRGRLYFGDYAGRVFCLSARTGRTIWVGSAGSRVYGTVAVADGKVFAPSVFSGLSALSADTGRLLWRNAAGAYVYSSPAYYRGRVYYGSYSGAVYAADGDTGRIRWTGSAGGSVSGAIQIVAGVVYAGSFNHRITAWNWRSGRKLWSFPHGEYVPVSGNGARLLMHGFSSIWAVEPRQKKRS